MLGSHASSHDYQHGFRGFAARMCGDGYASPCRGLLNRALPEVRPSAQIARGKARTVGAAQF